MALPGPRDLYDRFERLATPLINDATRTDEFARAAALVGKVNKVVRAEVDKLAARAWHAVNLPAGTDVQRMRQQLGSLDREVRLLALELERARKEAKRHGDAGSQHD